MNLLKISESINKAYRRIPISKNDMLQFQRCLRTFYLNVTSQGLEKNKETYLRDFLKATFYGNNDINKPNDSDIDWAIRFAGPNSSVGIIIEDKTQRNKQEMITTDDLNRKAMQQLVYYYLEERIGRENIDVRHLIANNMFQFFVFDGQTFEKYFYQNKKLVADYKNFKSKTSNIKDTLEFYDYIGSNYIKDIQKEIPFTYFDLQKYASAIKKDEPIDKDLKQLAPLYRIFSDVHLLKLPFHNDSNSLNTLFYAELLHILGLEEVKDKDSGKKIIRRLPSEKANAASFMELAISQIRKKIYRFSDSEKYGKTEEEQLFNIALELCITWTNRILFLKLLESQLLKYHKGDSDYLFLTYEKISDFDMLNYLFFDVLAADYEKRDEHGVRKEFEKIPYLNSSLFEETTLEDKLININSLMQTDEMPILSQSVLRKAGSVYEKKKRLPTLEYLFAFLNSYDFASEGNNEEIREDPKSIISASVLGLIFEKINGHKDGAVFTPGFVTMYMAHEAVRRTIIQKFNDTYKDWNCQTEVELYNKLSRIDVKEANSVFNSIKICDPAVGSGHFLVSVLNELVCAKYDLGILADKEGRYVNKNHYRIEIENDELIVSILDHGESELFCYHYSNPINQEEQRIQELLFNEKRTIIENCLFGVDLNPNSVNICCLRLWIELLKNSYYTAESNYKYLETLPNIDINIKRGNSVLSKYPLNSLMNSSESVKEYKKAVADYKKTSNKEKKWEINRIINEIKSQISSGLRQHEDNEYKVYAKILERYNVLTEQFSQDMFGYTKKELRDKNKEIKKLKEEIDKRKIKIEEKKNNTLFRDRFPFEWRFEFPEILDDDGVFMGFDLVIGNPPYVRADSQDNPKELRKYMMKNPEWESLAGKWDLYIPFVERGIKLSEPNSGLVSFIIPDAYCHAEYAKRSVEYVKDRHRLYMIDYFPDMELFTNVGVRNIIINLKANHYFGKDNEEHAKFLFSQRIHYDRQSYEERVLDKYPENLRLDTKPSMTGKLKDYVLLSQICYMSVGIVGNSDEKKYKGEFEVGDLITDQKDAAHPKLYFEGKDIGKWKLLRQRYIEYGTERSPKKWRRKGFTEFFEGSEKIVVMRSPGRTPRAMLDNNGGYFNESAIGFKRWKDLHGVKNKSLNKECNDKEARKALEKISDEYSYKSLLAIMNSRLIRYELNSNRRSNIHIYPDDWKVIKIPRMNAEAKEVLESLVDTILSLHADQQRPELEQDIDKTEQEIDLLVYHLYSLTYDDVLIVDPETSISKEEYEQYRTDLSVLTN